MAGITERFQRGFAMGQGASQAMQQAAQAGSAMQTQNKLADFMKNPENVRGLMTASPNALAGYVAAGGSPKQAMDLQKGALGLEGQRLNNAAARQGMDIERQKFEAELEANAAKMTASERQAAADKTRQGVQAGMTAQNPEQWDRIVVSLGQPDLVGKFDMREAILSTYLDAAEFFERYDEQNAGPIPLSPEGKVAADVAAGIIPESEADPVDFETEQKLRKEFTSLPVAKAFSSVKDALGRIKVSAEKPSAAGDLALIFNFMKILDPGSVVRESEFATAEQATAWLQRSEEAGLSVPQPVASAIRKFNTGQRLSPEQRQDFVTKAGGLFNAQAENYNQKAVQYRDLAQRYNVEPDAIAIVAEIFQVEGEEAAAAIAEDPTLPEKAVQKAETESSIFTFESPEQESLFLKYAPSE